jgi:hypothetical protein
MEQPWSSAADFVRHRTGRRQSVVELVEDYKKGQSKKFNWDLVRARRYWMDTERRSGSPRTGLSVDDARQLVATLYPGYGTKKAVPQAARGSSALGNALELPSEPEGAAEKWELQDEVPSDSFSKASWALSQATTEPGSPGLDRGGDETPRTRASLGSGAAALSSSRTTREGSAWESHPLQWQSMYK